MPGRVGMVSGLFFGFIFGIGGIGAALLGTLADWEGQRAQRVKTATPDLCGRPLQRHRAVKADGKVLTTERDRRARSFVKLLKERRARRGERPPNPSPVTISPALNRLSSDQRGNVWLHLPAASARQIGNPPVVVEPQPPLAAQVIEVIAGYLLKRFPAGGGTTSEAGQQPGSGAWGLRRRGRHAQHRHLSGFSKYTRRPRVCSWAVSASAWMAMMSGARACHATMQIVFAC